MQCFLLFVIWRWALGRWPEVLDNNFLGEPFGFEEVKQRWPRLVQTLGISEDQALRGCFRVFFRYPDPFRLSLRSLQGIILPGGLRWNSSI